MSSAEITTENPPGLPWIVYRDHDAESLEQRMLERLAELFPAYNRVLLDPTGPDLGVTFARLFGSLLEILSFYQDCRANEAFLRTARLESSLAELARLIDYRPAPGASAAMPQVFLTKPGAAGTIPAGFRMKAEGRPGKSAVLFETVEAVDVDFRNNALKLAGHDRSMRRLNAPGQQRTASVLLDQGYPGLKAGGFVVLEASDGKSWPLQLAAVREEADTRRLVWDAEYLAANLDLPISELVIHGRPKQVMLGADRARADELSVGATAADVTDTGLFQSGDLVLFASDGVLEPAELMSGGAQITWTRALATPLRRSRTRVYRARPIGVAAAPVRRGALRVEVSLDLGASAPAVGEQLVVSDGLQLLRARIVAVAGAGTSRLTLYLGDPLLSPLAANARIASVRLPESGNTTSPSTPLEPRKLAPDSQEIELDKVYDGLAPDALLVVEDGVAAAAHRVLGVDIVDDRTRLRLTNSVGFAAREASLRVHGPFEHAMRIAGYDRSETELPAETKRLTLSGSVTTLKPSQHIVVVADGVAEAARITAIEAGAATTSIDLETPLTHTYPVADTTVYANVAQVTHGETVVEQILGSGDRSLPDQVFRLRRSRLSHVHGRDAERGVLPSLAVDVDGERWTPVRTLLESGPDDRHYEIEIDEKQQVTLRFGDGTHGARLPTGLDNVRATYRVGLGSSGNVPALAVAKMAEPLPFLESTRNPLAASGGQDPENITVLRELAAMVVRTADRAVTLSDYVDLMRSHAAVAKARADWEDVEGRRVVALTVAAAGGAPLGPALRDALAAFVATRASPEQTVTIRDHRKLPVRLEVEVTVTPRFLRLDVQQRIEQALGAAETQTGPGFFQFERLGLGQPLSLAEIYAHIERVVGVDSALVTVFRPEAESGAGPVLKRIQVPHDRIASGGHPVDAQIGILRVYTRGGRT